MAKFDSSLQVIAPGMPWPSGDCADMAILDISEAYLRNRLGVPLVEGTEEGMGPWQAVGLRLASGVFIELIVYAHAARDGFDLRVDRPFLCHEVLVEALAALGLDSKVVTWVSPLIQESE
jgi:hypothetical protein